MIKKKFPFYFTATLMAISMAWANVQHPFKSGTPEEMIQFIDQMVAEKVKDKSVLSSMVSTLEDPDLPIPVKERAAWAIGQLELRSEVEPLVKAATHKSLLVRSAALNSLIRMRARTGLPVYIEIAKNDPILALRQRATLALGLLRWEKTIDSIVELSSDVRDEVRGASTLAMGAAHNNKNNFSQIIKEMTQDPSQYVQERAGLAQVYVDRKNNAVKKYLAAEAQDLRLFAGLFLHHYGNPADLKELKIAANVEADEEVRHELKLATLAIEKRIKAEKKREQAKKQQSTQK